MNARISTALGGAFVLVILLLEARGLYWGAFSRGHKTYASASSGCNFCIDMGSTYFWADSGDSLDLDFDLDLNRGVAQFWIARVTPGTLGDVEARTEIAASGAGSWHAPISRRGWYHFVFYGTSQRRDGYDIAYKLDWRIRHNASLWVNLSRLLSGSGA